MGELVDQHDLGMPREDGVEVHLVEPGVAADGPPRHDLELRDELGGLRAAVRLDETDHHVGAALLATAGLAEHGVGLADARGHPEVDAQLAPPGHVRHGAPRSGGRRVGRRDAAAPAVPDYPPDRRWWSDGRERRMSVVDNAIYIDGKRAVEPDSLDNTFEALHACPAEGHSFGWIGMLRPDEAEIRAVAQEFGLHPLAVEDTINAHQRPKLERYGDVLFVVLRPARYVDHDEVVDVGEIHLFLGPDFVITVRHAEEPDLGEVRARLEADPELLRQGPYAVLYAILDKVVDDYSPVLDGLQTDIDEIEVQVFGGDPKASRRIYQLSREVIEFQRAVEPLGDLLRRAARPAQDARERAPTSSCGGCCATSPTTPPA